MKIDLHTHILPRRLEDRAMACAPDGHFARQSCSRLY
jgi:hypothetical protein